VPIPCLTGCGSVFAPITTRYVDVWDAFEAMRRIVSDASIALTDTARRDVILPP
jgi:hypothetical protein